MFYAYLNLFMHHFHHKYVPQQKAFLVKLLFTKLWWFSWERMLYYWWL